MDNVKELQWVARSFAKPSLPLPAPTGGVFRVGIIGVLVGGLVIGMYLPIFKIAATVVG